MPRVALEFRQLLQAFASGGVDFIVVGGMAAILNDVIYATQDVDIVHRRDPENIERTLAVIRQLNAYFWPDPSKRNLSPRASDLAGHGHVLLRCPLGRLDVLCELSNGRGYEELLPHTREISEDGLALRVLDLPMLIQVKTEAGRGKDLRVIPDLAAALEERSKRQS